MLTADLADASAFIPTTTSSSRAQQLVGGTNADRTRTSRSSA